MTTHIEIPYRSDAMRAELAASDAAWLLTLLRPDEPRELLFFTRNSVGDGIPGGDRKLGDATAVTGYFESRLKAAGYDPRPAKVNGDDLAAWDLLRD